VELSHNCLDSMIYEGSAFKYAGVDNISHIIITCVIQLVTQCGISKWCVACMRELFNNASDEEFSYLFFRVNP
jgi:hypothetical protein